MSDFLNDQLAFEAAVKVFGTSNDAALREAGLMVGRGAVAHMDAKYAQWKHTLPRSARSSLSSYLEQAVAVALMDERERIAALVEKRGTNNVGMVHHVDAALALAIRSGATE